VREYLGDIGAKKKEKVRESWQKERRREKRRKKGVNPVQRGGTVRILCGSLYQQIDHRK